MRLYFTLQYGTRLCDIERKSESSFLVLFGTFYLQFDNGLQMAAFQGSDSKRRSRTAIFSVKVAQN